MIHATARVSVVMGAYNAGAWIGEAVSSLLNQTFADFELFVVDDGSIDDTGDVAGSFTDSRIVVLGHRENRVRVRP